MYPVLKVTGYGIDMKSALVMVWAGLRGAVGLSLALFILFDGSISDKQFRVRQFFFVGFIAGLTILIQGTTTGLLLQASAASAAWKLSNVAASCMVLTCHRDGDGLGSCSTVKLLSALSVLFR